MYNKELSQYVCDDDLSVLNRLNRGLHDEDDPITWRTAVVRFRSLILNKHNGGEDQDKPDWFPPPKESEEVAIKFAEKLFENAPMERLLPEFIAAVYDTDEAPNLVTPALEALIYNARHYPEPMVYRLYEEFEKHDKPSAVVNPVGHYNDHQTRIVGPRQLFRDVNHLVYLASTQESDGGNVGVLVQPLALLREELFTPRIKTITVVLPMYGGSRGHRRGQSKQGMKEVYEAAEHAETISLKLNAAIYSLTQKGIPLANLSIRVASIDIHNLEMPRSVFAQHCIEFVSVSPAREFAQEVIPHLEDHVEDFDTTPLQLVAADEGAIPRTEKFAREMLSLLDGKKDFLDIVYIDKERVSAGQVDSVAVGRVKRCSIKDGVFFTETIETDEEYWHQSKIVVSCDDMVDTVGTQTRDSQLVRAINHNNVVYYASVATHAILSKGDDRLDQAPIDHYFLGDTLRPSQSLVSRPDVSIVSLAPALYRELFAE